MWGEKKSTYLVSEVLWCQKKWFLEHTYLCLKNQEVYQWDQSSWINSFVPTEKGWGLESHGEPLGACHIRKRVSWINIGLCAMETHLRETGKESEYQAGTCAWWISNAMQECRSANRGMTWGLRFGKFILIDHVEELVRNHVGNHYISPAHPSIQFFKDEALN